MIIPSIDIMEGQAVQLVGGRDRAIDAGDPHPIAEQFALAGEIAVVDLDAALGTGSNAELIHALLPIAPCRVGGGIRSVESAVAWLDRGATKVVLGTAATPEVLRQLPRERVIAALDAVDGEVVVEGWRTRTGHTILQRMETLRDLASGFLVTFVEREGRLQGSNLELARQLREAAGDADLTVAGGITTPDEIAALDKLGIDAQVGMALYSGRMELSDAIAAPLTSDRPDGLWPTVVTDEAGVALGLAWSSTESLNAAVRSRSGVYQSRSRGIWRKGETSGATQELVRIDLDCDRDALRFTVRQHGSGFCHRGTRTCWGEERGLGRLARRLAARLKSAPDGSYTRRLLDNPALLACKLIEEAHELVRAETHADVVWEAADLIYFTLVRMVGAGVDLSAVEAELERRSLQVTRRDGAGKEKEAGA